MPPSRTMTVHANCLSGSHRGRWRVRLQVRASNGRLVNVMRDTGREPSRTGMHRVTASLGRTLDTVRFRRAYGRPPNGDDSKTGRAHCSSQPSPGTCAPAKSPSFSMCHQRRSAAGHRRAGCPTSAPWAATDATPTPRSGPCWRPCPSHPRPTSRAPRLRTAGITVVYGLVAVRDRPPLDRGRIGPGYGRLPPGERQSG
jgi:hypothetical protein